jgi:hypothetical protein
MDPFTTTVVLFTAQDGQARFREHRIPLGEGSPQSLLSKLQACGGVQFRRSPVGFRSAMHCTPVPQFVFILAGEMEIGLPDGSARVFGPGQHFYSADVLPEGASFDPKLHGHWSAQRGAQALETLFVRAELPD